MRPSSNSKASDSSDNETCIKTIENEVLTIGNKTCSSLVNKYRLLFFSYNQNLSIYTYDNTKYQFPPLLMKHNIIILFECSF